MPALPPVLTVPAHMRLQDLIKNTVETTARLVLLEAANGVRGYMPGVGPELYEDIKHIIDLVWEGRCAHLRRTLRG